MKIYLVTTPSDDYSDAESVDAVYTDEKIATSHSLRVWGGDVKGPYDVLEDMPDYIKEFPEYRR